MNRLDRISAILVQLQSRSVVRAADCAGRFGVSVRTIYRDIRTLEQAGVPVCGDAGVGYSLVEGYRLPPLMFTPGEALAFLTAEKFIEQMTDPHNSDNFRSGMDKVRAVMRGAAGSHPGALRGLMEGLDEKISVYRSRRTPEAKMPGLLQTLLRSVGESETLLMEYTGADGRSTRREIEAVGVTFSHPFWYLAAWCHLRDEYRIFRLDRIDSLEATGRPHTIEAHPPLETLMEHDGYACLTEVVIRTTAEAALRNRDMNYYMGLVEERPLEDGRVEQRYMSYSIEGMARWVLSHADTTEAVSPAEVGEWIEKIVEQWKRNSSR